MENASQQYFHGVERKASVSVISQLINEQNAGILDFIHCLQTYLTDTDIIKRTSACELMRDVLEQIFEENISGQECSVLAEFFFNRLKDHYSLHVPVLSTLVYLTNFTHLPTGTFSKILQSVVREVHIQSCLHADRKNILLIISNGLDNYMSEILSMGRDFLFNFIQIIDGEQDPRNLVLAFQLAYKVYVSGIDITPLAEECFEVVGCYFPIDFQPPSNVKKDQVIITNEQLVLLLRKVLSCSSLFAPYCIPVIIEKVNSNVQSAKLDAILTLQMCLKVYSVQDIKPHLFAIWNSLRREVMYAESAEIENKSLELITDLVKTIASEYTQSNSFNSELEKFLQKVKGDCLDRLTEPLQEKLIWSSSKLLIACGKASKGSSVRIFKDMVPVILNKISNKNDTIADRRMAMEILVHIITVCNNFNFDSHIILHPLYKAKEKILNEFYNVLSPNSHVLLKKIALAGICGLCKLGALLDESDITNVIGHVYILLNSREVEDIKQDLYDTLGFIANKHPALVQKQVIDPVIKIIENDNNVIAKYLDCLSSCCTNVSTLSTVCTYLLNLLSNSELNEENQPLILKYLNCLEKIVNGNCTESASFKQISETLIKPLLTFSVSISITPALPGQCCSTCSTEDSFSTDCITWPIIQATNKTLQVLCQNLPNEDISKQLQSILFNIFVRFDLQDLKLTIPPGVIFNPYLGHSSLQGRLISVLTACLCSLQDTASSEELNKLLLGVCFNGTNDRLTYVSAAKCLAGLLNKEKSPSEEILNKILFEGRKLKDGNLPQEVKMKTLAYFIWTTKALTLCAHKSLHEFISVLLGLFDSDMGKMAADSFDIILRETDEVLNKKCHAKIRLMYRQRFFQMTLSHIVQGFEMAKKEDKFSMKMANYLVALSHMLKYVPKQVLQQNFEVLFPLLINALGGDDAILLESVLGTLYCLVEEAKSSIEIHIDTLIKNCLRLSRFSQMAVRIQALKCIGVLTLLPTHVLIPQKNNVIRELSKSLDDRKRLVRQEAVKARSEWCLVGEST